MTSWIVETLVASCFLMLLVLVVRRPVRRMFGAQLAYALWLLPALRLLLPPLPGAWHWSRLLTPVADDANRLTVIGGVLRPAAVPDAVAQHVLAAHSQVAGVPVVVVPPVLVDRATDAPSVGTLLIAIWLAGAALFLAANIIRHRRYCHNLIRQSDSVEQGADGHVRILRSLAAKGPLAFGIWRKYVAFPVDFEDRYDARERDLALAHELGHHARGDLIANWAALSVLALHWFNPLAWRAFHAFRVDQEMACDAHVLAGRAAGLRHAYGLAIVKSAHGGRLSAACHLHNIRDVKDRLKMLNSDHKTRRRIMTGAMAVIGLSAATMALTASGTTAHEIAPPPAPAVPAVPALPPLPAAPAAPIIGKSNGPSRQIVIRQTVDGKTVEKRIVISGKGAPTQLVLNELAGAPVPPVPPVVQPGEAPVAPVAPSGPAVPEVPAVPAIADAGGAACPTTGNSGTIVVQEKHHGRKRIIICQYRVEARARDAAQLAVNSTQIERDAYRSALASIRSTRATMASQGNKEAVAELDKEIAKLEAQLARVE